MEFTNDISEIDFGEIDDIVGGCNYVDEIIVPLEYLGNYIEDPEDRFFPFYLYEQLKGKRVLSQYNKMMWSDYKFKVGGNVNAFYFTGINGNYATTNNVNVVPANTAVGIKGCNGDVVYAIATTDNADNVTVYSNIHNVSSTTCVSNSPGNNYFYYDGSLCFTKISNTVCFEPYSSYLTYSSSNDIYVP